MPDLLPPAAPSSAVLRRDRLTWLNYASYALFGYFLYTFSASAPLLRDDQGTSSAVAAAHEVSYAVGAVVVGAFGDRVVRRLGRKRVFWTGLFGFGFLGVALYCAAPAPWLSLSAALISGLGVNLFINVSLASLSERHGRFGAAVISEASAIAATMGILAPLALGGVIAAGWNWRIALLLPLPMLLLVGPVFGGEPMPDAGRPADGTPGSGAMPRGFWPVWTAFVLCSSFEFCFVIWSSDVLRHHAHASKSVGTLGVSAIVLGVVIGRLVTGRISHVFPLHLILHGALAAILFGFCLFWLPGLAWVSMVGLLISGIGVGPMFPFSVARVISAAGAYSDRAAARSSLGIGVAYGSGPFLIGLLADHVGTYRSMLLIPALVVAAAVSVQWSTRVISSSSKVDRAAVRASMAETEAA